MLTPLIQIMLYLGGTFVLGLALGWVLWKFGSAAAAKAEEADVAFWQQRFEQVRSERDLAQDRIDSLESEREMLKKRVRSLRTD